AAFYSDHFAQALRQAGMKVITASEISAMLSSQRQQQLLGCADDGSACMAELANALGATRVTAVGQTALLEQLEGAARRLVLTLDPPPPISLRKWSLLPGIVGVG